jgi:PAS domain S-box-containing protein
MAWLEEHATDTVKEAGLNPMRRERPRVVLESMARAASTTAPGAAENDCADQAALEAQAVLEMMARVFSPGTFPFRSAAAPSSSDSKRLAALGPQREAIVTINEDGAIETFNPAAEEIFDYPAPSALGKHVNTLFGAESSPLNAIIGPKSARSMMDLAANCMGKRRDGSTFSMELTGTTVELGGERRFVLVVRDVTERDRAEAQRRTAEARFRSLVEQIPAVTFLGSLHEDRNEFYVSPQIEQLLGFSQQEWLSDPFLWFNQLHPDDHAYCNQEFARGCVTGGPFRAEFRALTRAGAVVWVRGEARVVTDDEGRPLFIQGIAYDITEAKRAEEAVRASAAQFQASLAEQEVLLKEIHHRVKNNLQVISSLLRLQATHIKDPAALEMFNESRNRIESMALVHEKLYQSANLSQVDFREYARSLAALLIRSYGARAAQVALKTEIGDISLSVDVALPLGFIINELLSNCLKYAFPGGSGGEVRIEMHRRDDGQIHLIVADNGAGFPAHIDFRDTSTLGMQLVCALTGQLGGTIELRPRPGAEFLISFRP